MARAETIAAEAVAERDAAATASSEAAASAAAMRAERDVAAADAREQAAARARAEEIAARERSAREDAEALVGGATASTKRAGGERDEAVRAKDDAVARARLAERKMQDALDEQIRAEEEAAELRAELENARAELAEVRAANPAGGNAGISSASSPAGDGYGAGYSQSGGISADEAAAMEVERYQLVAELQAKSRKLEEAKAEADRLAARANEAERERDVAVAKIESLASELEATRESTRRQIADAGDVAERLAAVSERLAAAETRAAEAERELASALAALADAAAVERAGSDADREVDGTGDGGLQGGLSSPFRPSTVHEAVAAVRRDADARIAAAEKVASTAAAALEAERLERGGAEEALRSKIRSMDAAQDRLLAEIDAATGELERLDAELDATEERARAAEEREREALDGVAAAAMKTDRLMEMLTEQEEWEREAAEAAAAAAAREGGAGGAGVSASAPTTPAKDSGVQDGDENSTPGAAARTVPATPARKGAGRASTASVKLAADILQGSDLGRAYHPLLASIEARLLHLQSEKLDVPLADVPVS